MSRLEADSSSGDDLETSYYWTVNVRASHLLPKERFHAAGSDMQGSPTADVCLLARISVQAISSVVTTIFKTSMEVPITAREIVTL